MIVVRKNLVVHDGQGHLFDDYRYFFYLTNNAFLHVPAQIIRAGRRIAYRLLSWNRG
jgi:hypothetical protein